MIVIKGQLVQVRAELLTLKQKLIAFVQYHTTQVVAFFGVLLAAWQMVPTDLQTDLFTEVPFLGKWKTIIMIVLFLIAYYKAKMTTQVITVPPAAPVAPVVTPAMVAPMVLVPAPSPQAPVMVAAPAPTP